ncbi:MAG: nickel pincer cofactor biosynthesis protein LarC [Lachnospiraceae bacterium]|nr:nickel pincer cofactor biosynthesis protein LarC [Lachnospiraceae bacterium]
MNGTNETILYIDCGMGAAGDMLGAALYELLGDDDRRTYIDEINRAGIEGMKVEARPDVKAGIAGTHMSVYINGEEEMAEAHHHEHDHEHEHHHHDHGDHDHGDHDHDHHHHHHHASLADVHAMIDATSFSDRVKSDACAVYDLIASAESRAHNAEVGEIHFHEVGMKDAIIDVLGVCRLVEMISPAHIYASPIRTGFGEVRCAHGIVPVPAPATAYLLKGVPVYAGDIRGEMCTPTGAALLRFYAEKYCSMPAMIITDTGYGCGTKDFERANCVRAVLGTAAADDDDTACTGVSDASAGNMSDTGVIELATNIDDMTGEALAYAAETMREAGALDVYFTPVYMKKNRPGYILTVLCRAEDEETMSALFFKHTSTWGIRRRNVERRYMDTRIETRETQFGPVRFKVGEGYGVTKSKPEYEDIARIAGERGMSIRDVHDRL